MNPDTNWPAKPLHGTPLHEQPRHELSPKRQRIVLALDELAKLAEAEVIPPDADGDPVMLPEDRPYRTPEDFVLTNLQRWLQNQTAVVALPLPVWKDMLVSPTEGGQPIVNGKLWIKWALLDAVAANVMLIPMRTMGHIMSPIRGDIAVMHDGHSGIVTYPQCSGCRHFEMAEFTPRGSSSVPTVQVHTHWLSTVSHLIRIVLPREAPVAAKPSKSKKPADIETAES